MAFRSDKINEEVKRELAQAIRFLKDPRITGLVSVMDVEVTKDLKYAKVYVSVFKQDEGQKKEVLKGLQRSAGFLRQELKKRLLLRQIPELSFVLDESIGYGAHINELMKQIEKEEH